jgi:FAD/FMN-containing dehydrogenase
VNPVPPHYLTDASGFSGFAQEACSPADEAAVVKILQAAVRDATPVTVAGAGTGLMGGRVPQDGIVLSLEKFRKLDVGKGRARVGSAVTLLELRDAAAPTNQFFAPDPTEITASIGGVIATNASGSRSFRYGSARGHIVALRVALMSGRVEEYRRGDRIDFEVPMVPIPKTTKNTAGYRLSPGMDWIDLFTGSEGTLGVVLEAELSLLPIPANLFGGVVFFASDEDALDAVDAWRPHQELRMLEYVDRNSLDLLRGRYPEIPKQAIAALLIEAEGDCVDLWEERLLSAGALIEASWFAIDGRDRERLPDAGHSPWSAGGTGRVRDLCPCSAGVAGDPRRLLPTSNAA